MKALAQTALPGQYFLAPLTRRGVGQGAGAFICVHNIVARQFACDYLESFTLHAKHLAVLTRFAASSLAGRSFSINKARARCSLDRTVPIAHFKIPAAST